MKVFDFLCFVWNNHYICNLKPKIMKTPIRFVFLLLVIPLVMLFLQIDRIICLAVTLLVFIACGYVYKTFTDSQDSETANDDNMNNKSVGNSHPTPKEYATMGTKDLCLQLLQKMNINTVKDEDEEDSFSFEYLGEKMSFRATNQNSYILLYDTFWKKFPVENLEMVSLARKAVNKANIEYNGFKLLYTFNQNTMWIHSNTFELIIPEIPHVEDYFKQMLDHFLFAHKAFDEAMYDLMKEEGEKEK